MTSDGLIDRLPRGSRVLIIRLRALGDCVLSTPAIHLLKQYRPDLHLAVVADPPLASLYSGNPDLSEILPPTFGAVRAFRAALCLNLHGGTRSARLTLFSGAPHRAAYDMLRYQRIYNLHIPTAQRILGINRQVHTAEHMASAIFYLGVPQSEIPGASLYPPHGRSPFVPAAPYAVYHPAASRPDKMWPLDHFRALAESLPLEPVFIGGPADDLPHFSSSRTVQGAPLSEIAQLLRDADLFVGNDSGPAHMAAALRTPALVLFGPSIAGIWGPWKAKAEVLQAAAKMDSITVDDAICAARKLTA